MENGQMTHGSPYTAQIERFADTLSQISNTFLQMDRKKKAFTNDEIKKMFDIVDETVCKRCSKHEECRKDNCDEIYKMWYEILSAVDQYGDEMNVEIKRKLQQNCEYPSEVLQKMLELFHEERRKLIWMNRVALSREGCAIQMDTFAEMIRVTAKELEDSVVTDERLEKKIMGMFRKRGVRVLQIHFFLNREGKYEIHITARAIGENYITVKEIVKELSVIMGREMLPAKSQAQIIGKDYKTFVCIEGTAYYTLQGVARIGKSCNKISGDNFMIKELPGGRQSVALSDGMGAGESASYESTLVIELLEELLEAGFPEKMAIQMINTTLVLGREEIHYSTMDLGIFDLYSGKCRLLKAGASSTFIKRPDKVEHICSTSLPIGVIHRLEIDQKEIMLEDGDFVIMVTDGIMDALPVGEQELLLETIIKGTTINNPKDLAEHILKQILNWSGDPPKDDMTVIVTGIWKYQ